MAADDSTARNQAPLERPDPTTGRTLETVSQASRITQELRRRPVTAPRAAHPSADPALDERRDAIETRIGAHLGGRLSVLVTDNRYTMISVKREKQSTGPAYQVRLHRMFLDAPAPITRALARYIADNDPRASRELGRFIETNQGAIARPETRTKNIILRTAGRVHDLADVYATLNARYFGGRIDARITWGPMPSGRRRRRSIKMGSYAVEDRLIRIHPSLDREVIPRFFVEWIVYHEMLHQVHGIPVVGGRRQFHPPAFLADEAQFERFDEARRWERQYLDLLLDF